MMLLSNEEELVSSNGGKIILTNQRIHMADREWGSAYSITFFLEDISSIEMRYSSSMIYLTLGIIAALFCSYSFASDNGGSLAGISLLATIVFFVLYWLSRKHIVSITSHGGKALNFEAASLPEYEMQKFLTKVQEAKLQRMDLLKNLTSLNV
jgi:branched-subunit amino acid transport protein